MSTVTWVMPHDDADDPSVEPAGASASSSLAPALSGVERRLASWLDRVPQVLAQHSPGASDGELPARLALVHLLPDRGETVTQWPVDARSLEQELPLLCQDVWDAARQDAQSFTGPQRYAVCLFASTDLDAEPLVRHVFRVHRGPGAPWSSASVMGEGSEPATTQGQVAQLMRHNEAKERASLMKDAQLAQFLDRAMQRQTELVAQMSGFMTKATGQMLEQLERSEERTTRLEERYYANLDRWEEASSRLHERAMEREERDFQRMVALSAEERAQELEVQQAERRAGYLNRAMDVGTIALGLVLAERKNMDPMFVMQMVSDNLATPMKQMFEAQLAQLRQEVAACEELVDYEALHTLEDVAAALRDPAAPRTAAHGSRMLMILLGKLELDKLRALVAFVQERLDGPARERLLRALGAQAEASARAFEIAMRGSTHAQVLAAGLDPSACMSAEGAVGWLLRVGLALPLAEQQWLMRHLRERLAPAELFQLAAMVGPLAAQAFQKVAELLAVETPSPASPCAAGTGSPGAPSVAAPSPVSPSVAVPAQSSSAQPSSAQPSSAQPSSAQPSSAQPSSVSAPGVAPGSDTKS